MTELSDNPDVPNDAQPGQYLYINSRGQAPGAPDRARTGRFRLNVVAPVTSDGTLYMSPDSPVLIGGLDDLVQKCGKRSPARQMVEYAYTRRPAGVDIYVTPIVMSTGTASVFNIYVALLGAATAAVGSGQPVVKIDDYEFSFQVDDGDLPATIAAKLKASYDLAIAPALSAGKAVPYTTGAVAGNAVPFTCAANGAWSNDEHPVAVYWPSTITGVALSPGFITFAAGPTGALAGQVTVRCHAKTQVLSGVALGVTAIQLAVALTANINSAGDFSLRAAQRPAPSDTIVDLLYKPGRPAHDIQVTINAAIGPVTAAFTGETLGTGTPSLSNALAALEGSEAMQEWVTCFKDAGSIGSLVQTIRTQGNGYHQKEQHLTWMASLGLSTSGAVVTAVTPSIVFEDAAQASPGRNIQLWHPNTFQPSYCLAAMVACDRAYEPRPTKNFDGRPLVSNLPGIPLTYPAEADRPSETSMNQARSVYFMTPLVVKDGNFQVQQLVTTYGGSLPLWSSASYVRGMAHIRQEMLAALAVFSGKEFVRYSPPLTEDVFDTTAVSQVIYARAKLLEKQNLYDGADKFRPLMAATPDPDPNHADWTRVYIPGSPPLENHRIAGQIGPVAV